MHLSRITTATLNCLLIFIILTHDLSLSRKASPRVKLKRQRWRDLLRSASSKPSDNTNARHRSAAAITTRRGRRPPACRPRTRPVLKKSVGSWRFVLSPFHPQKYYNDADCQWMMRAPKGRKLLVEFLTMDIELEASSCKYDSLTVHDGGKLSSPRLIRYCGQDLPRNFISTHRLTLWSFRTDRSVTQTGFRLRYKSIMRPPMKRCPGHVVNLTEPVETFLSPNFELYGRYGNNYNCKWLIKVAPEKGVRLTFNLMDLEISDNCGSDNLKIYDGGNESAPLRASLCRATPGTKMTSSGHQMYLVFTTDAELVSRGFNITYEAVDIVSSNFECGKPAFRPRMSRIVGGTVAYRGSWPWIVSIRFSGHQWRHWCAASLLSSEWAVTAAHCFYDLEGVYHGLDTFNFNVIAGDHNQNAIDSTETAHNIEEVILHENYRYGVNDYDIAVFRFANPVAITNVTIPVCLTELPPTEINTTCVVVGWGETRSSSESSSELRQLELPLIDRALCRDWYGDRVRQGMICAGFEEGGRDACNGDSGGPLVCPDETIDNKFYLQGITSWGIGCAIAKQPGVYTDVNYYAEWIREITEIED